MLNLITSSSNYIFMIMCAIYAVSCITILAPVKNDERKEEKQIRRMERQANYMFLFHFISYAILFAKTLDYRVIALYAVEALFFKLLRFIYAHIYTDHSRILLNHMCFLLFIGFVMLTRLKMEFAIKQLVIVVVVSLVVLIVPYIMEKAHWLKSLRWVYGILGFGFLMTVFFFGTTKNGSTNWISAGPISLQPSEFVKIVFIFFVAAMLEKRPDFKRMVVTSTFAAMHVIVLILEKDLGGALLFFVVYIFMCYAATGRGIYLVGGFGAGALAAKLAYLLFGHVRVRFQAWSDPWSDMEGVGYHVTQSLFAIGTGGWFGSGLTLGRPTDVPEVYSDSIFAAICEELGCFFGICLIIIYIGIFLHFLQIAMKVKGRFYKLIGFGFSICFIFQVFLCIGGMIKFIPMTGVTLPLISYGGSSVTSVLLIFAIMQGVYLIEREEEAGHE